MNKLENHSIINLQLLQNSLFNTAQRHIWSNNHIKYRLVMWPENLVLSLDAFIASKERIFLWISYWLRLSIFYSFRVCVRQISHVRNERHSENSTTRDWWIIETSLTLLIYHFSDFNLFQDKKINFILIRKVMKKLP